jgi:hypothetical protein
MVRRNASILVGSTLERWIPLLSILIVPACGGSGNTNPNRGVTDGGESGDDATADASSDGPVPPPIDGSTDATMMPYDSGPPTDGESASDARPDGSGDGGFVEATHSTPIVTPNGGPILAAPELVTITYADDTNRATEEAVGAFLPKSQWLLTVGKEYGIGAGTSANVELAQNAPTTIDDSAIQSFVAGLVQDGTAPDPVRDAGDAGAGDGGVVSPAVYMIYFPTTTNVTVGNSTLCDISSGGYHYESSVLANGHSFAYAVVSPCAMGVPAAPPQNIAWIASHEFIEASTDPYPVTAPGYVITDSSQPWGGIGGEVGDLCTYLLPQWSEGPYTALQRVYSNASAKAGGSPCIPTPEPYYGVDVEPQTYVAIAPGAMKTFDVTGWSTAPVAPWAMTTSSYAVQGSAAPTLSLGTSLLQNGATTTLTVTMPAGTASQTYVDVYVFSEMSANDYTTAIVGVYTP